MSRAHLYLLMSRTSRHFPSRKRAAVIEEFCNIPRDAWIRLADDAIETDAA